MDALCDAGRQKPKVIAIGGPTATGKTALSVLLAKRFDGEIISADSMQIYRGLDVGTAKATEEERCGVPHYLLDVLPPQQPYSVAEFVADATGCISDITQKGGLPIVTGGTGLYITSLLDGLQFASDAGDATLRAKLEQRAKAGEGPALYKELCQADPDYAEKVHPNNLPRVIRALELYYATGRCMSAERRQALPGEKPFRSLCLCLDCHDRAVLYDRINTRVDRMLEQGILPEAELVWQNRTTYRTAAQAIGYKEFFPYFEGTATLQACADKLKQASRNYAKRQLTWFRHQTDAVWLYIDEEDYTERALHLAEQFVAG